MPFEKTNTSVAQDCTELTDRLEQDFKSKKLRIYQFNEFLISIYDSAVERVHQNSKKLKKGRLDVIDSILRVPQEIGDKIHSILEKVAPAEFAEWINYLTDLTIQYQCYQFLSIVYNHFNVANYLQKEDFFNSLTDKAMACLVMNMSTDFQAENKMLACIDRLGPNFQITEDMQNPEERNVCRGGVVMGDNPQKIQKLYTLVNLVIFYLLIYRTPKQYASKHKLINEIINKYKKCIYGGFLFRALQMAPDVTMFNFIKQKIDAVWGGDRTGMHHVAKQWIKSSQIPDIEKNEKSRCLHFLVRLRRENLIDHKRLLKFCLADDQVDFPSAQQLLLDLEFDREMPDSMTTAEKLGVLLKDIYRIGCKLNGFNRFYCYLFEENNAHPLLVIQPDNAEDIASWLNDLYQLSKQYSVYDYFKQALSVLEMTAFHQNRDFYESLDQGVSMAIVLFMANRLEQLDQLFRLIQRVGSNEQVNDFTLRLFEVNRDKLVFFSDREDKKIFTLSGVALYLLLRDRSLEELSVKFRKKTKQFYMLAHKDIRDEIVGQLFVACQTGADLRLRLKVFESDPKLNLYQFSAIILEWIYLAFLHKDRYAEYGVCITMLFDREKGLQKIVEECLSRMELSGEFHTFSMGLLSHVLSGRHDENDNSITGQQIPQPSKPVSRHETHVQQPDVECKQNRKEQNALYQKCYDQINEQAQPILKQCDALFQQAELYLGNKQVNKFKVALSERCFRIQSDLASMKKCIENDAFSDKVKALFEIDYKGLFDKSSEFIKKLTDALSHAEKHAWSEHMGTKLSERKVEVDEKEQMNMKHANDNENKQEDVTQNESEQPEQPKNGCKDVSPADSKQKDTPKNPRWTICLNVFHAVFDVEQKNRIGKETKKDTAKTCVKKEYFPLFIGVTIWCTTAPSSSGWPDDSAKHSGEQAGPVKTNGSGFIFIPAKKTESKLNPNAAPYIPMALRNKA